MKSKLKFGVGVNNADYPVSRKALVDGKLKVVWSCPFYGKWYEMVRRCYSDVYHRKYPTYIGCSVDKHWHIFSNFRAWMETQDWEGKQLDKDILVPRNKVYNPDTCVFITGAVNKFLTDSGKTRGNYPIGVYLHECGKFKSQVSVNGSPKHLGLYNTPSEAHAAWRSAKHNLALNLALTQKDQRVADALKSRYTS